MTVLDHAGIGNCDMSVTGHRSEASLKHRYLQNKVKNKTVPYNSNTCTKTIPGGKLFLLIIVKVHCPVKMKVHGEQLPFGYLC